MYVSLCFKFLSVTPTTHERLNPWRIFLDWMKRECSLVYEPRDTIKRPSSRRQYKSKIKIDTFVRILITI